MVTNTETSYVILESVVIFHNLHYIPYHPQNPIKMEHVNISINFVFLQT